MDPETEKHFAALILEEAARLRLRADKEGVHAYLAKSNVRDRPNRQFLKATVRGIEQANRAVEVNGMWKRRAMELEIEERERKRRRRHHRSDTKSRSFDRSLHSYCGGETERPGEKPTTERRNSDGTSSSQRIQSKNASDSASEDTTRFCEDDGHVESLEDDFSEQGLREEEIDEFLHSRIKRGRGSVGSRMDETGPYQSAHPFSDDHSNVRVKEEWERRIIGPSLEFGEGHLADARKHRPREGEVDRAESTLDHRRKKKEKVKKKHRSLHKKAKKKSDAL